MQSETLSLKQRLKNNLFEINELYVELLEEIKKREQQLPVKRIIPLPIYRYPMFFGQGGLYCYNFREWREQQGMKRQLIDPDNNVITFVPLHQRVLVVAVDRPHDGEGAWTAYIGDVPGKSHRDEYLPVVKYGDKLSEAVARAVFSGYYAFVESQYIR
jgi:hypothetical protein